MTQLAQDQYTDWGVGSMVIVEDRFGWATEIKPASGPAVGDVIRVKHFRKCVGDGGWFNVYSDDYDDGKVGYTMRVRAH